MTLRLPLILSSVLAAGVLAGAPAGAQEAKPAPTTCGGLAFTDPAGDQTLAVPPASTGQKTRDNLDLLAGWFTYAPNASGKNVMTANIQVTNLDDVVQSGGTGHTYYFYFDVNDGTYFVNADLTSAGWTYGFGDLGVSGPGNNQTGDTTGKNFPGKDGVISITVPISELQIANKTLAAPRASSRVAFSTPAGGLVPTADDGPDSQAGKAFRVAPCAEGTTPTPGGETAPTPVAPAPGGSTPPPAAQPAGPTTLNVKVVAGKQSAKKIAKARKLTVKLQAGEKITNLKAKLVSGKKTVGTGKLASVSGAAKLTLKTAKKFKAGTYSLLLTGTNAAGKAASATVSIKVAK